MKISSIGLLSALIYTGVSVLISGAFLVVTLIGDYDLVTRIGGTFWVFLLSMIILMPMVTQQVKRRLG